MAVNNNPKISTNGLVLCLDLANVRSYPGSGTTVNDLSGNGKTFSLYPDATGYSSTYPNRFVFDGSRAVYKTDANVTTSSSSTLVMVMYTTDTTGLLLSGVSVNGSGGFYVGAYYPGVGWYSGNAGSPSFLTDLASSSTMNTDNNFHMYEVKGINFSSWGSVWNFGYYGAGYEFNNGGVGFIAIYNRSISSDESAQNYYALRKRFSLP